MRVGGDGCGEHEHLIFHQKNTVCVCVCITTKVLSMWLMAISHSKHMCVFCVYINVPRVNINQPQNLHYLGATDLKGNVILL